MRLKQNDLYGMGASILLHLILIIGLGLLNMASIEPPGLGYMEVDFGPLAEGEPQPETQEPEPEEAEEPEEQEQPEPEEEQPPPEEPQPVIERVLPSLHVNLPDPILSEDEEILDLPEPLVIASEEPSVVVAEPTPPPEEETIEAMPDAGTADEEEKAAPFDITGLENRSLIARPLPAYLDNVSAVIRMRITVDPSGRVTQVIPVRKGTPALEREAQRALRRWRFSALPANAPRTDQVGIVTLRFVIE